MSSRVSLCYPLPNSLQRCPLIWPVACLPRVRHNPPIILEYLFDSNNGERVMYRILRSVSQPYLYITHPRSSHTGEASLGKVSNVPFTALLRCISHPLESQQNPQVRTARVPPPTREECVVRA